MKRLTISMLVALGFACIGQASASIETYTVNMDGHTVVGFVGATPAEVAQAERLARNWENQRHLMLKPPSMKAVAIRQSPSIALTKAELRRAIVSAALTKEP
ncbi:hypothetical protein DVT68_00615 [Dyella solisilvae]|uniref:Uncharacterized protein n=1 Tax=Dyella solisilvae TaxID=1920168 RepID=A0A370KBG4_9GAMM|nr:hypothetical protein [Dyella solisilvae]RDI99400.1 hypothetical protein DVT68_00615 [Dyella solisilvae]